LLGLLKLELCLFVRVAFPSIPHTIHRTRGGGGVLWAYVHVQPFHYFTNALSLWCTTPLVHVLFFAFRLKKKKRKKRKKRKKEKRMAVVS
jgi:hypothetical protein